MFEMNHAKVTEGRTAYAGGLTIQGLVEHMEHAYKAAEAEYDRTRSQSESPDGGAHSVFKRAEMDTKSFAIGFADGLLADFRRVSGNSRGGLRA
jgi:hypothetical protein